MSSSSQKALGLWCPEGGDFYACADATSQFLGCCTSNACESPNGQCPDDEIRVASFESSKYSQIPAQDCADVEHDIAAFYTCSDNDPPFLGCCLSIPCGPGACPDGDLVAAKLSSNPANAAIFLPRTTPTASASSISTPGSSSSSSNNNNNKNVGGGSRGLSPASIAGITVGSLAAALLFVACVTQCFVRKRKIHHDLIFFRNRSSQHESKSSTEARAPSLPFTYQAHGGLFHQPNITNSPQDYSSPLYEVESPNPNGQIMNDSTDNRQWHARAGYSVELPTTENDRR